MSLKSLSGQSCLDFEVLVADDGSRSATRTLVEAFRKIAPFPLRHVWHEKNGFRLAQIRNEAVAKANGDYLLFTDGDCFFLPDFVRRHLALAERGFMVAGKRSWLRENLSRRILGQDLAAWRWSRVAWLAQGLGNQTTRPLQFLQLPLGPLRKLRGDAWKGAQTCNLGVWRDDCLAVDGFDEMFVGHGFEDSDFVVRLLRSGVRRKSGQYGPIALHLWHPRPDRMPGPTRNQLLFEETLHDKRTRARVGLSRNRLPERCQGRGLSRP